MNEQDLHTLLAQFAAGEKNLTQTTAQIKRGLFASSSLPFACPDHHRELRHGVAEVIYGEGKTLEQIVGIAEALTQDTQRPILITRLDPDKQAALATHFPNARQNPIAKTLTLHAAARVPFKTGQPFVSIVCAGTSDIPVAEEALEVCITAKIAVHEFYDVGVAGLHRLFGVLEVLQESSVIIVVAGMEGALPSVIGGLVSAPIIAVPTSVGYGTHFGGVAALLGMLNSCAPGLVVTNIDAGFSAGFAAVRIMRISPNHL